MTTKLTAWSGWRVTMWPDLIRYHFLPRDVNGNPVSAADLEAFFGARLPNVEGARVDVEPVPLVHWNPAFKDDYTDLRARIQEKRNEITAMEIEAENLGSIRVRTTAMPEIEVTGP